MSEAEDQNKRGVVPVGSEPEKPAVGPPSPGQSVTEIFATWSSQQQASGPHPDVAAKVTEEHITKSLEMLDAHDLRLSEDAKDNRAKTRDKYVIVTVGIIAVTVAFLVSGNADQLEGLIQVLIPLVAVGFGGYGWGRRS